MKHLLTVVRRIYTDKSTIGGLSINGFHICYTLEDKVRPKGKKINDKTAIPAGKYRLILDYSTRFQKIMPHILDVPGFTGIRLHPGNTEADTSGCIVTGWGKDIPDRVTNSVFAYDELMRQLKSMCGDIKIEIFDTRKII